MEPNVYHTVKPSRRFRTEAEYRLWQVELAYGSTPARRPNGVRRMFSRVLSLLSRRDQVKPGMGRPATSPRQTQTIARVTK